MQDAEYIRSINLNKIVRYLLIDIFRLDQNSYMFMFANLSTKFWSWINLSLIIALNLLDLG